MKILIIFHTVLNLLMTFFILKHKYLERNKKFGKIVLVWFVPILGLLWVWIMIRTNNYQNTNNNDPIMYSGFDSPLNDNSIGNLDQNSSDGGD